MRTPAEQFEAAWGRERGELRRYFLRQRLDSTDIDDCLQEVAMGLWKRYSEEKIPEDVSAYSKGVAKRVLWKFYDQLHTQTRVLQYEPPEYFEKCTIPFADVWGRHVPSTRWELAEDYSLAPLRWAETVGQLEPLIRRDYPILYYLSQGATIREVSEIFGLPIRALRYRTTQIRKFLLGELSSTALQQFSWRQVIPRPSSPVFPSRVQRSITARILRRLPGYVPEWILWFSRLTAHTTDTNEPITFGVIQRLAQASGLLNEEQGKRFLLAATSHRSGLLTQKFFQIMPRGEPRTLSFSDISKLLRSKNVDPDNEWMDQIATAWEPTSKWRELADW